MDKPIPEQYKKKSEEIIHDIGKLADKLYPFITEMGDNVEIECGECVCIIKKRGKEISKEKTYTLRKPPFDWMEDWLNAYDKDHPELKEGYSKEIMEWIFQQDMG